VEDLRLVTERLVEIIGEAARAVTPQGRAEHPGVDWIGGGHVDAPVTVTSCGRPRPGGRARSSRPSSQQVQLVVMPPESASNSMSDMAAVNLQGLHR